jgi:hypothetical protein
LKDTIQIKKRAIIAQLSVAVEKTESSSYIGYIPSFDIPFTSPRGEKSMEIAKGLIDDLFTRWLKQGGLELFIAKPEEYKFFKPSKRIEFEHFVPKKSFQILEELHVI